MNTTEELLIGACLVKPDMLDLAAVSVRPEHFNDKRLGNLYGLMLDLVASNIEPSISEMKPHFKGDKLFGFTLVDISRMMDVIPLSINIERWATLIKEDSIRRGSKAMSRLLSEKADTLTPSEISVEAARIAEYAAENSSRADESVSEKAVSDFMERLSVDDQVDFITTGIEPLDMLTGGFYNSEVTIIAGRPSMGKSAMGLALAKALVKQGHPGAIFSLEMNTESLMQRLISDVSGVFLDKIRRKTLYDQDWPKVTYAAGVVGSWPLHFIYNRGIPVQEIHARLRIMKRKLGVKWVIIDHLHLFKGQGKIFDVVSKAMIDIFVMAGDLDIPVIALAQLNRDGKDRANKKPTLYDLRGSGEIEQSSHNVMFVNGEDYHDVAIRERPIVAERELIIAKQRQGDLGTLPFEFEGRIQRITFT